MAAFATLPMYAVAAFRISGTYDRNYRLFQHSEYQERLTGITGWEGDGIGMFGAEIHYDRADRLC